MIRIQLITAGNRPSREIGSHVAFVAIPESNVPPRVITWDGRTFLRYAGGCGLNLSDGDIYRETSSVEGVAIDKETTQ